MAYGRFDRYAKYAYRNRKYYTRKPSQYNKKPSAQFSRYFNDTRYTVNPNTGEIHDKYKKPSYKGNIVDMLFYSFPYFLQTYRKRKFW